MVRLANLGSPAEEISQTPYLFSAISFGKGMVKVCQKKATRAAAYARYYRCILYH